MLIISCIYNLISLGEGWDLEVRTGRPWMILYFLYWFFLAQSKESRKLLRILILRWCNSKTSLKFTKNKEMCCYILSLQYFDKGRSTSHTIKSNFTVFTTKEDKYLAAVWKESFVFLSEACSHFQRPSLRGRTHSLPLFPNTKIFQTESKVWSMWACLSSIS